MRNHWIDRSFNFSHITLGLGDCDIKSASFLCKSFDISFEYFKKASKPESYDYFYTYSRQLSLGWEFDGSVKLFGKDKEMPLRLIKNHYTSGDLDFPLKLVAGDTIHLDIYSIESLITITTFFHHGSDYIYLKHVHHEI